MPNKKISPQKPGKLLQGALNKTTEIILPENLKKSKPRKVSSPIIKILVSDKEILIDRKDLKGLDISKLYVSPDNYVFYGTGKNKKLLHRILMNPADNLQVDHRNRNPLDNRRANLRLCSRSENLFNRPKGKNNKAGFKGVHFSTRYNCYVAKIQAYGIKYFLGFYGTAEAAAEAYQEAAIVYHGEFRHVC